MTLSCFDSLATRRAARAALTAARPDTTVVECRPLGRGNRKETALVTVESGERVVVQAAADPTLVRTEHALLDAVAARTAVPVPRVLAGDSREDAAAIVTEYVEGDDLHERFAGFGDDAQVALARTFGRYLAELHEAFRFEGCGPVAVADGSTGALVADTDAADDADMDDRATWLESYGRAGLERLPAEFDDLRGDLDALFDDPEVADAATPRLFPWDFRPGNALVADGEVAAVLDWESPLAAAPALSVAKAEYLVADWYVDDPEPLRGAFRAGYDSVRPRPTMRPVHRAAAICRSAVDSEGVVTNPGYPERDREGAVAFHRAALEGVLAEADAEN